MIKSFSFTSYLGDTVTVKLGEVEPTHGLFVTEIEGLGPVKANVNMSEYATQDGNKYNSARAVGRNIVLHISFIYVNSIEEVRLLSYKLFPLKKKVTFHIETDNRIAEAVGYVESNEPDIFSDQESAEISILCESPWFNDAGPNGMQEIDFSNVVSMFEFEFSDDNSPSLIFSEIERKRETSIHYNGETENGMILSIYAMGDFKNISIYNIFTGERMHIYTDRILSKIGDTVFKLGDEIQISTVTNDKYIHFIRDGVTYNILNSVDPDADWIKLLPGDNTISYTAEVGELNLNLKIRSQVLYTGV